MFALLNPQGLDAPLAWSGGVQRSGREFLSDVQTFARSLPAHGVPINLCVDRYAFAVAWVAAMARGQTSLMPPNPLLATLRQLQQTHPDSYLVEDARGLAGLGLESLGLPLRTVRLDPSLSLESEPAIRIEPELQAVCLLTSGSTDTPQPHLRTWRMLVECMQAGAHAIAAELGWPSLSGLHLLATVPPQHSYGLESSVMLAFGAGAVLHSARPFFPAEIKDSLEALPRPRALVTTPLHLKNLLQSGLSLPPVDLVLCATAPLSLTLAAQAENLMGPLIEIYGCTEAGQIATRRTVACERWRTMGSLKLSREVSDEGDVFFVQGGYLQAAQPLADTLQLVSEREFYLGGRANDLINVAGKRNSLSHLNMQLNRMEGVEDGCFWLPDARPDDVVRPVAFVVAPTLTAEQVIAGLRQRVEAVFVPRRVIHVEALPREATGKLTSRALRDFALQHLNLKTAAP